jgi:hypothetical protein
MASSKSAFPVAASSSTEVMAPSAAIIDALSTQISTDGTIPSLLTLVKGNLDDTTPLSPEDRILNLLMAKQQIMDALQKEKSPWAVILSLVGLKLKQLAGPMADNHAIGNWTTAEGTRAHAEQAAIYSLYRAPDEGSSPTASLYSNMIFQIWRDVFNSVHRDQFLFGLGDVACETLLESKWGQGRTRYLSPHRFTAFRVTTDGGTTEVSRGELKGGTAHLKDLAFRLPEEGWLYKQMMALWAATAKKLSIPERKEAALLWLRTNPEGSATYQAAQKLYTASTAPILKQEGTEAFLRTLYQDSFAASVTQIPSNPATAHFGYETPRLSLQCIAHNQSAPARFIADAWNSHFSEWMTNHPARAKAMCAEVIKAAGDMAWVNNHHPLLALARGYHSQLGNLSTALPSFDARAALPAPEARSRPPAPPESAALLEQLQGLITSATSGPKRRALPQARRRRGRQLVPGSSDSSS